MSRGCRIYVGNLPSGCRERDLEKFFKNYGRIFDILIKQGFGFVEFDDHRDADDAVYELNGKDLMGERVSVEHARGTRRDRSRERYRSRDSKAPWLDKYGPPTRTDYRLRVENLSTRVSWQDLKDLMRKAGDVTYADAHKDHKNEGIVEFASRRDMERAIDKFDDYDLNGRRIKLVEEKSRSKRSRTRSRSRDRRSRSKSRRSRSKSRRSRSKSRRSRSRSRSKSKRKDSRSKSRSRSRSAKKEKSRSRSRSRSAKEEKSKSRSKRSRSKSNSRARSRSNNRSKSKKDSKSRSKSKSRSRSKSRGDKRSRSRSRSMDKDEKRARSGSKSRSKSPEKNGEISPREGKEANGGSSPAANVHENDD